MRTIQDYLCHRDPKHTAHYTRTASHRFESLWANPRQGDAEGAAWHSDMTPTCQKVPEMKTLMHSLCAAALLAICLAAVAQESDLDADVEGRFCRTNSNEQKRQEQVAACTRVINDPQKFAREARDLALNVRARTYRDLRLYDHAIRDYSTLIEVPSATGRKLSNLYASRANAHWENGDLAAAESDFTSAIIMSKQDIDRAGRYERRALFYVRIQELSKALSDFKEALLLDPAGLDRGNSRLYVEELEKRGVKPTQGTRN